jgi:hypothetical protein
LDVQWGCVLQSKTPVILDEAQLRPGIFPYRTWCSPHGGFLWGDHIVSDSKARCAARVGLTYFPPVTTIRIALISSFGALSLVK